MKTPCVDHGQKGNAQGYGHSGRIRLHRKVFRDHRGYLPPVVMHACDNPRCINPEHLIAGNWDTNNKDRATKGRSAKAIHAKRLLTHEQVSLIRARYAMRARRDSRNGPCALAKEFGVDTGVVYQIVSGRTYRDIV